MLQRTFYVLAVKRYSRQIVLRTFLQKMNAAHRPLAQISCVVVFLLTGSQISQKVLLTRVPVLSVLNRLTPRPAGRAVPPTPPTAHLFAAPDTLQEDRHPLRALLGAQAVSLERDTVLQHPQVFRNQLQSAHFC
jgi:hypothetical protein